MRKIILVLFLAILLMPYASAVSPAIQASKQTTGLEVQYPAISLYPVNMSINFAFHVFNSTEGIPYNKLGNPSCWYHLYNISGDHIFTTQIATFDDEWDYEVYVNYKNFTKAGLYSYIIQCNTSTQGGFASVPFELTMQGIPSPTEFTIFGFCIFFIALMLLMIWGFMDVLGKLYLVSMALQKKSVNEDDLYTTKDLMLSWGAYFTCIIFYGLCIDYLGNVRIEGFLDMFIKIGAWTHFMIPLIVFTISFMLINWKKARVGSSW